MGLEQLVFWRRSRNDLRAYPDMAVAGRARTWWLSAVIVASSAALLGTSDDDESDGQQTRVDFAKPGIDGGTVELTKEVPSATFAVKLTADRLGVADVVTTGRATARFEGVIVASDLNADEPSPFVSVKVTTSPSLAAKELRVLDGFRSEAPVAFSGNCQAPQTGPACVAQLTVEVSRLDDGAAGGSVRFDWSFDLFSNGQRRIDPTKPDDPPPMGVQELPWTVEVSGP